MQMKKKFALLLMVILLFLEMTIIILPLYGIYNGGIIAAIIAIALIIELAILNLRIYKFYSRNPKNYNSRKKYKNRIYSIFILSLFTLFAYLIICMQKDIAIIVFIIIMLFIFCDVNRDDK